MKANGKKVWKQIYVKIIIGRFTQPWRYRANPHHGYTEEQIDTTLENVIEWLDREYPTIDFKQVQVGPNRFNFIATKVRDNGEGSTGGDWQSTQRATSTEPATAGTADDSQNSPAISGNIQDQLNCKQDMPQQGAQDQGDSHEAAATNCSQSPESS